MVQVGLKEVALQLQFQQRNDTAMVDIWTADKGVKHHVLASTLKHVKPVEQPRNP